MAKYTSTPFDVIASDESGVVARLRCDSRVAVGDVVALGLPSGQSYRVECVGYDAIKQFIHWRVKPVQSFPPRPSPRPFVETTPLW